MEQSLFAAEQLFHVLKDNLKIYYLGKNHKYENIAMPYVTSNLADSRSK
jgi:hypothetical protein